MGGETGCEFCGEGMPRRHVPVPAPFWADGEDAAAEVEVFAPTSRLCLSVRVLGEWVGAEVGISYCPFCGRRLKGASDAGA